MNQDATAECYGKQLKRLAASMKRTGKKGTSCCDLAIGKKKKKKKKKKCALAIGKKKKKIGEKDTYISIRPNKTIRPVKEFSMEAARPLKQI
jgi:hypothetical protein